MKFKGSFPALITPFKNGGIDEDAFQSFVNWQIEQGSHGLVPVGTTGESPTLNHDEHKRVVELCIEAADGRVPVIAGAGSNSTAEAVDLAKQRRLTQLAVAFLKRHGLLEYPARFDVVAVTWPQRQRRPAIEHFKNAFDAVGKWELYS